MPKALTLDHLTHRGTGWLLLRPDCFVAASGRSLTRLAEIETLLDSVVPAR